MEMKLLKKAINRIFKYILKGGKISYAQSGEDLILNNIFLSKNNGFYIDVGANHPNKNSNTNFFYKKGWTGINIDAHPYAIKLFQKKRKNDFNIEAGISDTNGHINYYMFKETSYNTFNKESVNEIKKVSSLICIKKVEVKPLSQVLKNIEMPPIDIMSVDVEGFDLQVLKSNNWVNYRPKVVVVENCNRGISIIDSPIYKYMHTIGYLYFCQTNINAFYIEHRFFEKRYLNKNR